MHVYTVFSPYLPTFTISPPSPPPLDTTPSSPRQDLFYSPVLSFCIRKEEEKNYIFSCLRYLHREFSSYTSMFICIIVLFLWWF
jgi:hypothetical protein